MLLTQKKLKNCGCKTAMSYEKQLRDDDFRCDDRSRITERTFFVLRRTEEEKEVPEIWPVDVGILPEHKSACRPFLRTLYPDVKKAEFERFYKSETKEFNRVKDGRLLAIRGHDGVHSWLVFVVDEARGLSDPLSPAIDFAAISTQKSSAKNRKMAAEILEYYKRHYIDKPWTSQVAEVQLRLETLPTTKFQYDIDPKAFESVEKAYRDRQRAAGKEEKKDYDGWGWYLEDATIRKEQNCLDVLEKDGHSRTLICPWSKMSKAQKDGLNRATASYLESIKADDSHENSPLYLVTTSIELTKPHVLEKRLVLSQENPPLLVARINYETRTTRAKIRRQVQESLDHYYRAGDENWVLHSWKWVKSKAQN